MSVFTDVRLLYRQYDSMYAEFIPTPLNTAVTQALGESEGSVFHWGNVGITAAVVPAPGRRPFDVRKTARILGENHFHLSSCHVNDRMSRDIARQHGITLTARSHVIDVRRRMACKLGCREGRYRAWGGYREVRTDVPAPYEVSMGRSPYIIMFADNSSRCMRPYGRERTSKI